MEVRSHEFFADVNWDDLLNKRVKAPWVPDISYEGACFDATYTQQAVNSVVNTAGSAHQLAASGIAPHNGQNMNFSNNNNSNVNGNRSSLIHNTSHFPDFAGFSWNAPMSYAPSPPASEFFNATSSSSSSTTASFGNTGVTSSTSASIGKPANHQPDLELVVVRSPFGSEDDDGGEDEEEDDDGEEEDEDEDNDDDEMEGFEGGAYPNFNGKLSSATTTTTITKSSSSSSSSKKKKNQTDIPSSTAVASSNNNNNKRGVSSQFRSAKITSTPNTKGTTISGFNNNYINGDLVNLNNNNNLFSRAAEEGSSARSKRRSDEEGLFDIDMEVGE